MDDSPSPREEPRIGTRLKHTRLTRGLTLKDLADTVGCSVSALSKIENRRANPSITMLHKICGALGTNMATLFADGVDDASVVTRGKDRPVITTDQLRRGHGIQLQRLVPYAPGYLLQGNVHMIEPGGYSNEGLQHEGEELGYVVEGTLELNVDGKTYIAEAGDSFFFRSDSPHSYRNPGDTVTRVIWVNTPPTF
ncbi:transcriptional regulator with XRE-family HTH domain [Natronocella acetinitrilica]|uniref:Transcriptional regulator with XRE-family HTH domain n=1 Tax=Natronocella acetinitrilica TaxID=414046 RepID=A0AAE3G1E4_9GAMM|nr:cupin domain-containing protein [Natronocella acetinitrilica]MCP1673764.1 transcriptional regulator with XRE-family HTH domain [Natronocella acetinitrilica]